MSLVLLHLEPPALVASDEFDLSLFVMSTESLTGIDYSLSLTGCVLLSRDVGEDAFPDLISTSLSGDLGGSVIDVRDPSPPGDHFIARYHLRVEGMADVALVKPTMYPNTMGWVGAAPDFIEHPFDGFSGAVVTFPEPTTFAMGLMLLVVWLFRSVRVRPSINVAFKGRARAIPQDQHRRFKAMKTRRDVLKLAVAGVVLSVRPTPIAKASTNVLKTFVVAKSGDWHDPEAWVGGIVPPNGAKIIDFNGYTLTVGEVEHYTPRGGIC